MTSFQSLTSVDVDELEEGEALELPPREESISLRKDLRFEDRYTPMDELGRGGYGVVKKCRDNKSGVICAAKFVEKNARSIKEITQEVYVMNQFHHKRIVYLMDAYETSKHLIVVMELITGGELFEKVVEEDDLTEKQVVRYMRQVLFGVQHMHRKNIAHLDLKPENILCVGGGKCGYEELKLIDFGLSKNLDPNKNVTVFGGTPEFVSPEVASVEPVTLASDMWSLGVITYVLMSGISPFLGDDDDQTMLNVSNCEWTFEDGEESFEQVSDEAKLFIEELLVRDPKERNSVGECLNHPWFVRSNNEKKLKTAKLKKFLIRRRWQKAANALRAVCRLDQLGQVYAKNHGRPSKGDRKINLKADTFNKLVDEASEGLCDTSLKEQHAAAKQLTGDAINVQNSAAIDHNKEKTPQVSHDGNGEHSKASEAARLPGNDLTHTGTAEVVSQNDNEKRPTDSKETEVVPKDDLKVVCDNVLNQTDNVVTKESNQSDGSDNIVSCDHTAIDFKQKNAVDRQHDSDMQKGVGNTKQNSPVDTQRGKKDTQSDSLGRQGTAVDAQSDCAGTKTATGAQTNAMDTQRGVVDTQKDKQCPPANQNPGMDKQKGTVDAQSAIVDSQSDAAERQESAVDTHTAAVATLSAAVHTQKGVVDESSPTVETQSGTTVANTEDTVAIKETQEEVQAEGDEQSAVAYSTKDNIGEMAPLDKKETKNTSDIVEDAHSEEKSILDSSNVIESNRAHAPPRDMGSSPDVRHGENQDSSSSKDDSSTMRAVSATHDKASSSKNSDTKVDVDQCIDSQHVSLSCSDVIVSDHKEVCIDTANLSENVTVGSLGGDMNQCNDNKGVQTVKTIGQERNSVDFSEGNQAHSQADNILQDATDCIKLDHASLCVMDNNMNPIETPVSNENSKSGTLIVLDKTVTDEREDDMGCIIVGSTDSIIVLPSECKKEFENAAI